MIDIHCHILPGVDDGSDSWETTLEMCRLAKQDGVTHIVATPHANFDYDYDRAAHQASIEELRTRFPGISFSLGCDFQISSDNVDDALRHPGRYTVGETRYLLIELCEYSMFNVPYTVHSLCAAGMIPILTHPERYPMVLERPQILDELAPLGCLFQITANSLTGFWGRTVQKFCQAMLKEGFVHFIASDAHSPRRRTPILSEARAAAAKIVGAAAAERLVSHNPAAVVRGEDVQRILSPSPL
jgi:protein-tyrosine phosphatase